MRENDSILSFGSPAAWLNAWDMAAAALRGRRVSIAAFTAAFLVTGLAAAAFLPRTYEAESRLLAQRNYVMPALAHPTRAVPTGADSPTQSAVDLVLNRRALEGIVRGADLLARWDRERPALLRLKDRVAQAFSGPISAEDKTDAIVELLAKRIVVNVNNEVIAIRATWSEPRTVVDIVNGGVEAFLEARRKMDVQAIADTYALLARTAEAERESVEERLADTAATEAVARRKKPAPHPRTSAAPRSPDEVGDSDARQSLRSRILEARMAIADAETRHQGEIRELETRLAQGRAVQTARHPDVIALQRALASLGEEPAELRAARSSEARLVEQYAASGGQIQRLEMAGAGAAAESGDRNASALADALLAGQERDDREEADAVTYSRSILKNSVETYQDILTRLANARIELEAAKAAFSYRYSVTDPARLPKKAKAPNRALIVVGALLAGLFAGVLRALFDELHERSLLSPLALIRRLSTPSTVAEVR